MKKNHLLWIYTLGITLTLKIIADYISFETSMIVALSVISAHIIFNKE
jgi:hypothetical protein